MYYINFINDLRLEDYFYYYQIDSNVPELIGGLDYLSLQTVNIIKECVENRNQMILYMNLNNDPKKFRASEYYDIIETLKFLFKYPAINVEIINR
jgi:hypothetical protein